MNEMNEYNSISETDALLIKFKSEDIIDSL